MKKHYLLILLVLLHFNRQVFAQSACDISVFPNPAAICLGDSIQLIAIDTVGSVTFTWSPATGLSSTSGAVVKASPVVSTTYKVKKTGCSDSALILVTVNQIPNVNPIANASYCNGIVADGIKFSSTLAGASFSWHSKNNLNIGFGINGDDSIPSFYAYNGSAFPVADTIIVNATLNGCTGPDASFIITVNPTPVVTNVPVDSTYCNGAKIPISTFGSSTPGVVYNWSCDHNIGFGTSGTGNIPKVTANIPGTDSIIATVTVSAVFGTCVGPDTSFIISVFPLPQFTSATSDSLCDNTVFNYTASATPGTSFSWTRAADAFGNSTASSGTTNIISETLHNSTDLPIIVKYEFTLTPTYSAKKKCSSTTTLNVTVNPTPKVDFVTDKIYCNGESVNSISFSSQSPDSSFVWSSDINLGFGLSGSGDIPAFVANNPGTTTQTAIIKVSANASGCQGPDSTFTISIVPGPALTSSTVGSVCNGGIFGYTAISSVSNTGFSWSRAADSFGNASSSGTTDFINEILYNTTDSLPITVSYNFELTASGACLGYDTLVVTVYPTPVLSSPLTVTTCDSVPFVYLATSVAPATMSWIRNPVPGISNGPNSASSNLINEVLDNTTTDTIVVTYNFTLAAYGCPPNFQDITVNVIPNPVLNSLVLLDTVCNDSLFEYEAISNTLGTTFSWIRDSVPGISNPADSADTNLISETLHNTTSNPIAVTYEFTLTEPNGCPYSQNLVVTVYPTLELISDTVATACDSVPFVYQVQSATTGVNVIFSWSRPFVSGISNTEGSGSNELINETLDNTTDSIIDVTYIITSQIGDCSYQQNLTVVVFPTPELSSYTDTSVCDNIPFFYEASSFTDSTIFSWSRPSVTGISNSAGSDTSNVIKDTLVNITDLPVVVTYVFTLKVGECTNVQNLYVTVNPTPKIDPVSDKVYCNGDTVPGIHFSSQTPGALFSWSCDQDIGFGTNGFDSIPAFPAENTDTIFKTAEVTVSIAASSDSCPGEDLSFFITVNPIPVMVSVTDTSICSGNSLNYLITPNFINGVYYSWTSDVIPVVTGNTDQLSEISDGLITDTLINSLNNAKIPVIYDITLSYSNSGKSCKSEATLTANVNPSPPPPVFTSVLPNTDTITLCRGSENINFNIDVSGPTKGLSYQWSSIPDSSVDIRNKNNPNTVISFNQLVDTVVIKTFAFNSTGLGGCPDSASQVVIINNSSDSISERKIILKQPGNLLIYTDNSMAPDSGYQWGYDTLKIIGSNTVLGPPQNIPDQVYQVFVPESKFLSGSQLDTFKYAFWVLLKNGECRSKVYYNGPYAPKRLNDDNLSDNTAGVNVYPNPVSGNFNISLYGNIYGNIDARIYNTLGEIVYQTEFEKKTLETTQLIKWRHWPDGMYLLELQSSDHKRITTRIIISN